MTPWQRQRDEAGTNWPQEWGWGPFHRHFSSDAIHRDNNPECDQPGTPRRVYVFDPEMLDAHELIVARYAIAHPEEFTNGTGLQAAVVDPHADPDPPGGPVPVPP